MIAEFFVDRPIFATVISVVFVLAGVVAGLELPVAAVSRCDTANRTGDGVLSGSEFADRSRHRGRARSKKRISGVEGMLYMSSQSTNDGSYKLTVTFNLGMDSDMAQVLVQNRVSLALPVVPALVQNEGITVKKMSPNTLMIVTLISPDNRYDDVFLSNYATIYRA